MQITTLPQELISSLDSESKDFAVKAGRVQPLKVSYTLIIIAIMFILFTSIFSFVIITPLIEGKDVNIEINGVPTVVSRNNLRPLIVPAIFFGVFGLVGITVLYLGIYSIFAKGGYFVGTPSRLVNFKNGKIKSIDWEQFSGNIELSGNSQSGNISLQLRTGRMVHRKNGPANYVPDIIHILQIENVFEIEKICRKRIKENDPTPASIITS